MAGSLNRVMIIGNLGQDPEIRYTPNQNAVATFSIATTEYRTSPDGQKQEITEWHRVVVWNKLAENCGKFLAKGRTVFVEGKLQTRSWDDKQTGQKRYTTEIVAQNVQFLSPNTNASTRGEYQGAGQTYNDRAPNNSAGQYSSGQSMMAGGAAAGFVSPNIPDFDMTPMGGSNNGGSHGGGSNGGDINLDDIPF
jgi:single-strand DNA-binding protein